MNTYKEKTEKNTDKELAAQCRQMGEYLMKTVQIAMCGTPSKSRKK